AGVCDRERRVARRSQSRDRRHRSVAEELVQCRGAAGAAGAGTRLARALRDRRTSGPLSCGRGGMELSLESRAPRLSTLPAFTAETVFVRSPPRAHAEAIARLRAVVRTTQGESAGVPIPRVPAAVTVLPESGRSRKIRVSAVGIVGSRIR